MDDRAAPASLHSGEHGHGAPDEPEVGDLGPSPVLLGRDVVEPRKDRAERGVHPDVDGSHLAFDALDRRGDLVVVRDIGRDGEHVDPQLPDLGRGRVEAGLPAGDEGDAVTSACELHGRRAADPGTRPGDRDQS